MMGDRDGAAGGDMEAEAETRGISVEDEEVWAMGGAEVGIGVEFMDTFCLAFPEGIDEAWLFMKSTSLLRWSLFSVLGALAATISAASGRFSPSELVALWSWMIFIIRS